jgi:ABC-type glycerol-3-phosphate transport system permease component
MGNFQWSVVTLQEFGADDQSTKIRLWIPLMEQPASGTCESGPNKAKVTLVMQRNDQLGAWWAKCQRNYRGALDYIPFWRYTATSVFLVILNIIGTVFSCSIVAFSFARLQWPGRNISFGLMLATMMIPAQVTMIPYFLIIKALGWYNTLTPLWVVSLTGNAFNIFLLRQFMKGIPRDLEDAARIDGCNSFQVYLHVVLPLVKPTLACIAIFTFMGVWNDFMGPLIYLSDQRLYPLSLGLYAFNVQSGGSFGMMMAGSLLMTMPVIAIFFFAQKYFIQGVTLTGMKG